MPEEENKIYRLFANSLISYLDNIHSLQCLTYEILET